MCKLTPQIREDAKQMIVNLEVAKTIDSKTNTRRLAPQESSQHYKNLSPNAKNNFIKAHAERQIDDILWIREPVQVTRFDDILQQYDYQYVSDGQNVYQADIPKKYKGHNNPKWMKNLNRVPNGCLKTMARTFIKITNVRVEGVQDISIDDILKEGIRYNKEESLLQLQIDFRKLWNKTAPKGYQWSDNPYVFVYEFEKVEYVK